MSYDNNNSGALFRNKDKTDGDNKPNYTGEVECNGVKMRIAGWMTESKNGVPYMSLKLSEPREQQNTQGKEPSGNVGDLDETPF